MNLNEHIAVADQFQKPVDALTPKNLSEQASLGLDLAKRARLRAEAKKPDAPVKMTPIVPLAN